MEVFDDWFAVGPRADDEWKAYEQKRGRGFLEALKGHAATHTFALDWKHLNDCDAGVLVLPAGKSGHLELGFLRGCGKKAYILLENDEDRWDVMYQLASRVFVEADELVKELVLDRDGRGVMPLEPEWVSLPEWINKKSVKKN